MKTTKRALLIYQDLVSLLMEERTELIQDFAQVNDWNNNLLKFNRELSINLEKVKGVVKAQKEHMINVINEKAEVEKLYHELKVLYDAGVKNDILQKV